MGGLDRLAVGLLLDRYGLELRMVPGNEPIPGSYWGDSEAGLVRQVLHARSDTPLHSVLHEAAHFVCMTPERRAGLDTDAGGDDAEECAVCYLQLLLAAALPQFGFERACDDMDGWGYSFRLGSTRGWFEQDAEDARLWLLAAGIVDTAGRPTGHCRT
ncbi:MAG: hypothetical protein ABIP38_02910 [Steroidobacteraceae bacterium]